MCCKKVTLLNLIDFLFSHRILCDKECPALRFDGQPGRLLNVAQMELSLREKLSNKGQLENSC